MVLKKLLFALVCIAAGALSGSASAEDFDYVSDNHSWSLTCNSSGYVLRSQYPVTRFHEAGANSSVTRERETLYLGKSCDATSSVLGNGKWCWANGGFVAEFDRSKMGFPRQELICPTPAFEFQGCEC